MKRIKKTNTSENLARKITRKEALIQGGKYAAITAASMLIILSPKQSQAQSNLPSSPTPWTSG
ncbi:MAG: hypothetical protein R2757_07245 [Draconibacterium sp.]